MPEGVTKALVVSLTPKSESKSEYRLLANVSTVSYWFWRVHPPDASGITVEIDSANEEVQVRVVGRIWIAIQLHISEVPSTVAIAGTFRCLLIAHSHGK